LLFRKNFGNFPSVSESMHDPVSEIKNRVPILDLVAERVELKKAGRLWKGRCPWHSEKTPSFTVSPEKGLCYCFGCHRGGDIFSFLQITDGIEFREALVQLAERAGVALPEHRGGAVSKRKRLFEACDFATQFFVQQLEKPEGEEARRYLEARGIGPSAQKNFRIGWAPAAEHALEDSLSAEGFSREELLTAGLLVSKNREQPGADAVRDKFRRRVIFPVVGKNGKVIAFSGRALGDGQPKYLNSPETPIFQKSRELFNFYGGRAAIAKKERAVLVEGQLDAIASWQAEIEEVVAPQGSAFTEEQADLLLAASKKIVLAFDGDAAGKKARRAALELLLPRGASIKIVHLSAGEDPDDICQKEGAGGWQARVENSLDWFPFLLHEEKNRLELTPAGKRELVENLLPLVKLVSSPVEQEALLDLFSAEIGTSRGALSAEFSLTPPPPPRSSHPGKPRQEKTSGGLLLGLAAAFPEFLSSRREEISKLEFAERDLLLKFLADARLSREEEEILARERFFAEEKSAGKTPEKVGAELDFLLSRLAAGEQKARRGSLRERLAAAQASGDSAAAAALLEELAREIGRT
jgi:DNA primase